MNERFIGRKWEDEIEKVREKRNRLNKEYDWLIAIDKTKIEEDEAHEKAMKNAWITKIRKA